MMYQVVPALRLNALMLSHLDYPTSKANLRTTSRLGGKKNDNNSVTKKVQKNGVGCPTALPDNVRTGLERLRKYHIRIEPLIFP